MKPNRWVTGLLSSVLDNAPTYLAFAMAAGSNDFNLLVENRIPGLDGPMVLQAISCGAVFMGALTYIGNGPNFMVKAIAEQAGYRPPSFFAYRPGRATPAASPRPPPGVPC